MNEYEDIVKRLASYMNIDAVRDSHEFSEVRTWSFSVPSGVKIYDNNDEAYKLKPGPICVDNLCAFISAKCLLEAFLKTPRLRLYAYFANLETYEAIQVENPFYGISIDELKVQLDLMGVGI